jgi:hypothetical protein
VVRVVWEPASGWCSFEGAARGFMATVLCSTVAGVRRRLFRREALSGIERDNFPSRCASFQRIGEADGGTRRERRKLHATLSA